MSPLQYSIIGDEDQQHITVVIPGRGAFVADNSHPSFNAIKACVEAPHYGDSPCDYDDLANLFDTAKLAAERFGKLSERINVAGTTLLLDGNPVHDSATLAILTYLDEGNDDWQPLVRFYENIADNPSANSREQLYDFLTAHQDYKITQDGWIIGYKGYTENRDGTLRSWHRGPAVVNGVPSDDPTYEVGDVVELARDKCVDDPSASCSVGLHVATRDYAGGFGTVYEVAVNPRDVVSVPSDAGGEKVRACRYRILGKPGSIDAEANEDCL